ncbi:hypothetical protein AVL56_08710 [Alteromonas stellipolaris]|uniref:hypothetical protein n=1 Tax=Alteromonas stellipolaris TaxID=233316 RepID=UPI00077050A2|nr:hypothetical protein [Alteromonas stellipolaris]AMJ94376.1 hypothetical protein AVL56_08710 [Alteromonas stellipolaris]
MKDVAKLETEYMREKINFIWKAGLSAQFFSPYLFEAIKDANEINDAKKLSTSLKELKVKLKTLVPKQF